eukprot:2508388-Rhodomonas_salina.1
MAHLTARWRRVLCLALRGRGTSWLRRALTSMLCTPRISRQHPPWLALRIRSCQQIQGPQVSSAFKFSRVQKRLGSFPSSVNLHACSAGESERERTGENVIERKRDSHAATETLPSTPTPTSTHDCRHACFRKATIRGP